MAEQRAMLAKAETEKRQLTADEASKFDALKAEITELEQAEQRQQFVDEQERRAAGVMNHPQLPIAIRADAAFKILPYQHARIGEVGKKQTKNDNAAVIARGRHKFATKAPPQLTVVRNGE